MALDLKIFWGVTKGVKNFPFFTFYLGIWAGALTFLAPSP